MNWDSVIRVKLVEVGRRTVFCLLIACGGVACSYSSYTTKLPTSTERTLKEPYSWSQLPSGGNASIGDRLFWVQRYISTAKERVTISSPSKLRPIPDGCVWSLTHSYDAEDGRGLFVYTCRDFYRGQVGVILDAEDKLSTKRPFVQVAGGKVGRRWASPTGVKFFEVPNTLIDSWGVRYGGRRGTEYVFEIVDGGNPSVSQIIQSLQISPAEFFSGFTVKGVFIKGLEDVGSGVIRYSLRDDRVTR
jgi:hypothetical protein